MVKIEFKSMPEYYKKERVGLKPNTVRNIEINEKKFQILIGQMVDKSYGLITIKGLHGSMFTRQIKDITVWGNIMIISWIHDSV